MTMARFSGISNDLNVGALPSENISTFQPNTIEPMNGVAAQALTSDGCSHCGWVKKEGNSNRNWKRRYMIVHKGCIYYFNDSNSDCPKGNFSLHGYRVLQAHDRPKYDWVLKLLNIDSQKRTYYIAAESEYEFKIWLVKIREEVEKYFGSGSGDRISPKDQKDKEDGPSHTILDYDYPEFVPSGKVPSVRLPSIPLQSMPLPATPTQTTPGRSKSVKERPASGIQPPKVRRSLTDPSSMDDQPPPPPPRDSSSGDQYETPRFEPPAEKRSLPVPSPRRPWSENFGTTDGPALPPKPSKITSTSSNNTDRPFEPNASSRSPISCTESGTGRPTPPPRPTPAGTVEIKKTPASFGSGSIPGLCAIPNMAALQNDLKKHLSLSPPKTCSLEPSQDHYLEFEPSSTSKTPTENTECSNSQPRAKRDLPVDPALYVIDPHLPDSASRLNLDKTQAGQLLMTRGVIGTYLMCKSQSAATRKALSVLVDYNKQKTYIIFKDENGYHLDPSEPVRCRSIEEMIKYYRRNNLPKINSTLGRPYKD